MRSDAVVIVSVGSQDAAQMCLAQDDKMIQALALDRSDQPLGKAIPPRRGRRCGLVPDAHGAQSTCDDGAVDLIPIPDQVARRFIPGERLGQPRSSTQWMTKRHFGGLFEVRSKHKLSRESVGLHGYGA